MQSSFKKCFQLIVFQKLLDWRLEKSYMRKHTCHLDHHQRSRYVTIGLEGKFHWVLQLINNQKEKLFDSHKKKLPDEQNSSNQPNQSPKPNCDRSGQPDNTQDVFVVKGETSRSQEIDVMKIFSRRTLFFREIRATCWNRGNSNTFIWRQRESECLADSWQNGATCCYSSYNWSTRQLSSTSCSWKRYAHDENHEPMMVNEADMDFKIPGLPHSARNSKQEFWDQKWKLWEERRGQESGNKTVCTKNSWRLLAMGNQRAVCERRQLQFPPRYE